MSGNIAYLSIGMVVPERKICSFRKVIGLVYETGTQTSGIHFLECNNIKLPQAICDMIHGMPAAGMWQDVFPAFSQVVVVTFGGYAGLNIVAQ
ncbi:MAG: hypothetical protein GY731_14790 [Gammaproteobacteria bacterium]|nr:hypothetical protein [Gammaproteobacteria bacterium]